MNELRSLACSEDNSVLFVGGGTDNEQGSPSIAAVGFDAGMQVVREVDLNMAGKSSVYSLKNFEQTNVLFAATYSSILVVYYNNKNFSVIHTIDDVVQDEIRCLKYINNTLYAACYSNNHIYEFIFPKLQADNKRKSIIGTFDVSLVPMLSKYKIEKCPLKSK